MGLIFLATLQVSSVRSVPSVSSHCWLRLRCDVGKGLVAGKGRWRKKGGQSVDSGQARWLLHFALQQEGCLTVPNHTTLTASSLSNSIPLNPQHQQHVLHSASAPRPHVALTFDPSTNSIFFSASGIASASSSLLAAPPAMAPPRQSRIACHVVPKVGSS